jgi:hypothetical protein
MGVANSRAVVISEPNRHIDHDTCSGRKRRIDIRETADHKQIYFLAISIRDNPARPATIDACGVDLADAR